MSNEQFITLSCPNCGAPLKFENSISNFACKYCGSGVLVKHSGDVITLHLVTETIKGIKQGTDRTAAELAVKRLREELESIEMQLIAISEMQTQTEIQYQSSRKLQGNLFTKKIIVMPVIFGVCAWFLVFIGLGFLLESVVPDYRYKANYLMTLVMILAIIAGFVVVFIFVKIFLSERKHTVVSLDSAYKDSELSNKEMIVSLEKQRDETKSKLERNLKIIDG